MKGKQPNQSLTQEDTTMKKTPKLAVNVESEKLPRSAPEKVQFVMPKLVPKWRARMELSKKDDQSQTLASSFGLSIKEKQNIPIDVEGSNPINVEALTSSALSPAKDAISAPQTEVDMTTVIDANQLPDEETQNNRISPNVADSQKQRAVSIVVEENPVSLEPAATNASTLLSSFSIGNNNQERTPAPLISTPIPRCHCG
ncbi:OLC1v1036317C2 [Oldenlandia corymbosa var. corymbosa]|uniref:OLC1v1036317C2 n=1 Tax=Oldenlandia corymbosa var. corymbosa TaxID=529605 RepID=A0AAV1CV44_OLDCO|nr:OLC1v1036317C2 [Oldenlandia corymbosa var. corymbosa]